MFEKKSKPQKRFIIKTQEMVNMAVEVLVIVDRETGVNYLMVNGDNITPLLDSDGKVVVDTLMEYK